MPRIVGIVDYSIGNLHSVARAITKAGARPELIGDPDAVDSADLLVLPGVGAFGPCAENLRRSGLMEPVLDFVKTGRPFLGICVGMQLLFDYSTEFGRHQGLGLIQGWVEPIPPADGEGSRRKVPHIGWSELSLPPSRNSWEGTMLAKVTPGISSAYFVHSFNSVPVDEKHRLADADYQGYRICAAVKHSNITGFQCHPEKSGAVGLAMFEEFVGS